MDPEHASSHSPPKMPSKKALRSAAAAAQQEQLNAMDEDYVGEYHAKRTKFNAGAKGRGLRTKPAKAPPDDRASRADRRHAAKRSNTEQPERQAASTRQGKRQRTTQDDEDDENDEDDESGGGDDNDEEYQEEGAGVDDELIAQAMNRGRLGPQQTVNGIGAHHSVQAAKGPRGRRPKTAPNGHNGARMSNRDKSAPETRTNQVSDIYDVPALSPEKTRTHQRAAAGRGTRNKETSRPINRPTTSQRRQPVQDQELRDISSSSDAIVDMAEDSAFIESPRPGEIPVLVKINSMGGIFKTLRHQAWTRRADWDRSFESDDKSDGDPTACKTVSGKALMKAAMSYKRLMQSAIDAWQSSEEADDDDIHAATNYLGGKSAETKRHIADINQAVEHICTEELAPPPPTVNKKSAERAIQKRRLLLSEISRRLIPMLVLLVNKACGLAVSEDHRTHMTIYFNTFTLQFFLRTIIWTTRLHNALCRGLDQWPFEPEFTKDGKDLDEDERKSKQAKNEAREVFGQQLSRLYSAAKRAEWAIQEDAAKKAEKQRREAKRRWLEEQMQLAEAAKEREAEFKRQRDAERYAHFARFTQILPLKQNPMQEKWDLDQAARERASQDTFARTNTPSQGLHQSQGQRTSGMVGFQAGHSRAGPSRNDQIEDPDDWDPFLESPPPQKRATPSNPTVHNRPNGFGTTQRPSQTNSQAYRPWTYKEDKILVKSIKYDRTYNLASMAAELGRSEHDVARKVALLKEGYRARFIERGEEIPAYAL